MKLFNWLQNKMYEVMDVKYNYTDVTNGLIGRWRFSSSNNNKYDVTVVKLSKNIYHIMFSYVDSDENPITSITNLNDRPTAIMNSVYNIVENEIIKRFHPKELRFEAYGDKRIKVYDKIIEKYISGRLDKYGYSLQTNNTEELPMKVYRFIKK